MTNREMIAEQRGTGDLSDMTKVTRYQCKWCGREFHTPTRHKCRFNPIYRSCLSCRHCGKYSSYEEDDWDVPAECVADGVFAQPTRIVRGFKCLKDGIEVGEGGYNDFPTALYGAMFNGRGCGDWELMVDYSGSKSFAKRQSEL